LVTSLWARISQGQKDRGDHHPDAQAFGSRRLGMQQALDGLLADQRRRGEHQARLGQAGEGLGLAVAEAVLGVGRGGGVAHGEEGHQRGDQVQAAVGQRGQHGHRMTGSARPRP
jgi:hypothetical protein